MNNAIADVCACLRESDFLFRGLLNLMSFFTCASFTLRGCSDTTSITFEISLLRYIYIVWKKEIFFVYHVGFPIFFAYEYVMIAKNGILIVLACCSLRPEILGYTIFSNFLHDLLRNRSNNTLHRLQTVNPPFCGNINYNECM